MSNDTCNDTCTVCGYWRGLHEYDTMRCPVDQRESGLFRDTVYQEETNDLAALRAENEKLREALEEIGAECNESMGEWQCVDAVYVPMEYQIEARIRDIISDVLALLGGEG